MTDKQTRNQVADILDAILIELDPVKLDRDDPASRIRRRRDTRIRGAIATAAVAVRKGADPHAAVRQVYGRTASNRRR